MVDVDDVLIGPDDAPGQFADESSALLDVLRGDVSEARTWLEEITPGALDYLQVACQTLVQLIEQEREHRRQQPRGGETQS